MSAADTTPRPRREMIYPEPSELARQACTDALSHNRCTEDAVTKAMVLVQKAIAEYEDDCGDPVALLRRAARALRKAYVSLGCVDREVPVAVERALEWSKE